MSLEDVYSFLLFNWVGDNITDCSMAWSVKCAYSTIYEWSGGNTFLLGWLGESQIFNLHLHSLFYVWCINL